MSLLTTQARAVLASGIVPLAFFAELSFRGRTERYWSGSCPLVWDGQTWLGVGSLGGASPLQSSEDFRANGLNLTLAGLPKEAFTDFQSLAAEQYKGRPARFIIAIMDNAFQSVVHAIPRYFTIDTLDYELDADTGVTVTVALEVETRRASRARVRRYTPQDQESAFPGDKAFEFVPFISSGVDVKWGKGGSFFPPTS